MVDQKKIEDDAKELGLGATGKNIGATGDHDQGGLKASLSIDGDRLILNFGKPIDFLSMTRDEALHFSYSLFKKADAMPKGKE